ncbi:DUF4345 domain-containing protein [Alphaproteobacteria bacterium GH1-50]|uniref:DUF4345 domain-containing protein n=1 Tax=Kangsaoukella pontilimi TaxID=2691042 RepID=A0A7C9MQS1_9RHOB|nr:DUF4345 family protein [Kangsaoukella pontilimi]MXQ07657.1 DUF4345 domain-containing protein [Kangsaoukella pontilimi]
MIDAINILLALASIGLGAIGWLAPRYTMGVLDLETNGSTMGTSEIRAASGALFIGLGLGALILGSPIAYAMIGFAWAGAAVGRVTSIALDEAPTRRTWGFAATEIVVAGLLLALNL